MRSVLTVTVTTALLTLSMTGLAAASSGGVGGAAVVSAPADTPIPPILPQPPAEPATPASPPQPASRRHSPGGGPPVGLPARRELPRRPRRLRRLHRPDRPLDPRRHGQADPRRAVRRARHPDPHGRVQHLLQEPRPRLEAL